MIIYKIIYSDDFKYSIFDISWYSVEKLEQFKIKNEVE